MGQEIERKFLVDPTKLPELSQVPADHIEQFYLTRDPWVRVRILNRTGGRLTIKGPGTLSRAEFEYPIPVDDAVAMRPMGKGSLTKTRYYIPTSNDLLWEIDEFHSPIQLWMAEIELDSPDEAILDRPAWLGKEVTEDFRYSNACLVDLGLPTACDLQPIFDLVRWREDLTDRYGDELVDFLCHDLQRGHPALPPKFQKPLRDFCRLSEAEREAVVREALREVL